MTHRTALPWTALAVVLCAAIAPQASAVGKYQGKEFPNFTAQDAFTGEGFSLRDLRGKVVLIDFWATWCGPCRAELPAIKRAYQKYHDKGFEIVSISLDTDKSRFASFVPKNGMKWYHVMEGGGWKTRLARKYGVNSIPRMFVIDVNGVCISENARGKRLEDAVKRGLAAMPDSQPDEGQKRTTRRADNRLDPALARRFAEQLDDVRTALERTTASLRELGDRLDASADAIDRLDGQLPAPDDRVRAKRRFLSICDELRRTRHAMFMLGFLDGDGVVRLPANPFEALSQRDPRAFVQVQQQLKVAREAIELMNRAYADVREQMASLNEQIGSLKRDISRRSPAGKALESRVADVRDEALVFAQTWNDPWQSRLDASDEIVARLAQPLTALLAELDSLDERLGDVRRMLSEAPGDVPALRELRDAFGAVCNDLRETYDHLRNLGIIGESATPLPSNPFEGRRLRDRRVVAELEVKIQVADDAVGKARQALTEHKQTFDALAEEAEALRCELDDRRFNGADLDDLREQFSELCRKVLALQDRLAGS